MKDIEAIAGKAYNAKQRCGLKGREAEMVNRVHDKALRRKPLSQVGYPTLGSSALPP